MDTVDLGWLDDVIQTGSSDFYPFFATLQFLFSTLLAMSELSFHLNREAKISVNSQKSLTHYKLPEDHELMCHLRVRVIPSEHKAPKSSSLK